VFFPWSRLGGLRERRDRRSRWRCFPGVLEPSQRGRHALRVATML